MPELIRSAVSRVRVYFKDRRQKPRLRIRLLFSVSIHRPTNGNGSSKPGRSLQGHTRDISASGLALLVPRVHLDGHHLAASGCELEVNLELGRFGTVTMLVAPRRYEHLEDSELGCAYLIGARIVKIAEADRIHYLSFISEGLSKD